MKKVFLLAGLTALLGGCASGSYEGGGTYFDGYNWNNGNTTGESLRGTPAAQEFPTDASPTQSR